MLLGSVTEGFSNIALESIYPTPLSFLPIILATHFCTILLLNVLSPLITLLPLLNTKQSLKLWALYIHYYVHLSHHINSDLRSNVVRYTSAEVNVYKWIKVINQLNIR